MSEKEIIELVSGKKAGELTKEYSAKELRSLYVELTGQDDFTKSVKKITLADALKSNVRARLRGAAFSAMV